ncbi:MAG: transpeptidase family protein [Alistipes sp.]|nr:transpeptidase family protein [Alistipes sp.]
MQQEPSKIKSDILLRVRALYLFFMVLVAVILVRLVYVQFFSGETRLNAKRLSSRIFLPDTLYARRGNILARDGEPLAISIFRYQPLFDFDSEGFQDTESYLKQSDSLAQLLSAYFGDRSTREYQRVLRENQRKARDTYRLGPEYDTTYYRDEGLVPLLIDLLMGRAQVTERVRDTIRNHRPTVLFPREVDYGEWEVLRRYPILNYNMGMTYTLAEYDRRIYPQGDLARRTIGRVTSHGHDYGLEMLYADALAGEDGFSLRQRIARGFSTRVGDAEHKAARDGMDVVTTLDLHLQDVADKALRQQLEAQNAQWGTTLVMEVETGEMLAMANLGRAADGTLSERENYALSRSMEPGSTFKLATVLALLDDAGMSPDKVYETHDGEPVTVGHAKNIRDSHRGDHEIALKRAVAGSSNVYFAKAFWEYYWQTGRKQQLSNYLHEKLGLGETVGLDSLGERSPQVTRDWKVPDPGVMLVKMAYGYRVQLTPLQMLTLYNAIANGGHKIAPVLVRELRREGEMVARFKTHTLRERICSEQTLAIVRDCLEEVAKTGTAAPFFRDTTRLRVAAKTGTAQITSGEAGHYLGSMVAYFPADKPRYTVLTTIRTRQQAGKAYYGAALAGPVVKRVVDYLYAREHDWSRKLETHGEKYYPTRMKGGSVEQLRRVADELSPSLRSDTRHGWGRATVDSTARVHVTTLPTASDAMPDVVGMGLKDALFLLESRGLKVVVRGHGTVVQQSLPPEVRVRAGETVTITLK